MVANLSNEPSLPAIKCLSPELVSIEIIGYREKMFKEIARKPKVIGISPYGKDIVDKPRIIEIIPNGTRPLGKKGIVRCLVLLTAAKESRKPLPSLLSSQFSVERIAQNDPLTPTRERLPSSSVSPSQLGYLAQLNTSSWRRLVHMV